ncbi:MAG: sulfate adenylyltransferase, partial [Gemmatimonadota bacterium]
MSSDPYGGTLVDRTTAPEQAEALRSRADDLPTIRVNHRILSDLYLIAVGGLSPLTGFMDRDDYLSVLEDMRLAEGLPWAVPVVLPATEAEAAHLQEGGEAALVDGDGELAAVVDVENVYDREVEREARSVYRTDEDAHPGVAAIRSMGEKYVAGPIRYTYPRDISGFPA